MPHLRSFRVNAICTKPWGQDHTGGPLQGREVVVTLDVEVVWVEVLLALLHEGPIGGGRGGWMGVQGGWLLLPHEARHVSCWDVGGTAEGRRDVTHALQTLRTQALQESQMVRNCVLLNPSSPQSDKVRISHQLKCDRKFIEGWQTHLILNSLLLLLLLFVGCIPLRLLTRPIGVVLLAHILRIWQFIILFPLHPSILKPYFYLSLR